MPGPVLAPSSPDHLHCNPHKPPADGFSHRSPFTGGETQTHLSHHLMGVTHVAHGRTRHKPSPASHQCLSQSPNTWAAGPGLAGGTPPLVPATPTRVPAGPPRVPAAHKLVPAAHMPALLSLGSLFLSPWGHPGRCSPSILCPLLPTGQGRVCWFKVKGRVGVGAPSTHVAR